MAEPILALSDVTMQFGGVIAVDNLSMEVGEGQLVALIGPNGAGKTTAFNVITGVYEPSNGAIKFKGRDYVSNFPKGKMKTDYKGQNAGAYSKTISLRPNQITSLGIARTFQNIRLFKDLTVLENVMIAKHLHLKAGLFKAAFHLNKKEEKNIEKESIELLKLVGLEENMYDIASSLPYGKQRHLEIARALATNPKLLLLDEPAAGMNPQETLELSQFIVKIQKQFNLSILMIEHHMDLVMSIAEKIYVLDFGKLISQGTPSEVQNDSRVVEAYLGVDEDVED